MCSLSTKLTGILCLNAAVEFISTSFQPSSVWFAALRVSSRCSEAFHTLSHSKLFSAPRLHCRPRSSCIPFRTPNPNAIGLCVPSTNSMSKQPNLYSYPDIDTLAPHLRTYILNCQKAALARHDAFKIAVSGGSLAATLSKALLASDNGTHDDKPHFSKWEIFFADERAVPLDHEDSNYGLLKRDLLDKIPLSAGKPTVHSINVKYLDDTQELADQYQEALTASFASKDSVKLPMFDLILLGCGPDGHTCSLFPGHELLRESDAWVAPIEDSPKPPPRRITLTLPVVTHGIKIAFVATGGGKKDILKKILETDEGRSLPCGLVNEGGGEKVSWFTDSPAVDGVTFPRRGSL